MEEDLFDTLNNYCRFAETELSVLAERLNKVLEARKKLPQVNQVFDKDKDVALLYQVTNVLKTIDGLQKIREKLPPAIERIQNLSQKLQEYLLPRDRTKIHFN